MVPSQHLNASPASSMSKLQEFPALMHASVVVTQGVDVVLCVGGCGAVDSGCCITAPAELVGCACTSLFTSQKLHLSQDFRHWIKKLEMSQ
jgi:alcohol dehydrogenase YqhD (iron-dependent ADH family)